METYRIFCTITNPRATKKRDEFHFKFYTKTLSSVVRTSYKGDTQAVHNNQLTAIILLLAASAQK